MLNLRSLVFTFLIAQCYTCITAANKDPLYGLHPELMRVKSRSSAETSAITDDVAHFLSRYPVQLPSATVAEKRIIQSMQQYKHLLPMVRALQEPDKFVKPPTRLLFVGPSGSGKTTVATSLIKYLQKDQEVLGLFIKGTSIANTYQNSGATYLHELFRCLERHPEHKFMVIIDELSAITKKSEKSKDIQRDNAMMALWTGLDGIKDKKHICIIGTDNGDPESLVEPLKTRFNGRIFYFNPPAIPFVVDFMRDRLNDNHGRAASSTDANAMHECSDAFLSRIAKSASYLSLREFEALIDDARAHAITESDNPDAIVEERHVLQALEDYKKPCWYESLWRNRNAHVKTLFSPRAISLYMVAAGYSLRSYSSQYKTYGETLMHMGAIFNYLTSLIDEKGAHDLSLIGCLNQAIESDESDARYSESYALQLEAQDRDIARMQKDDERYDRQYKDRIEDQGLDAERYENSRDNRHDDKTLEESRYKEQRDNRAEDKKLESERHKRQYDDHNEDVITRQQSLDRQEAMFKEGLHNQYILHYAQGLYAIPLYDGTVKAIPARDYLSRVREGEAARVGVDYNTYRDRHNRPEKSMAVGSGNERYT